MEQKPPHLIVGVDFGTTFSGFAYVDVDKAKDTWELNGEDPRSKIEYMDFSRTKSRPKIPSLLCYSRSGTCGCSQSETKYHYRWGMEVNSSCRGDVQQYFKLLLDGEDNHLPNPDSNGKVPDGHDGSTRNRTVRDFISDFLKAMLIDFEEHLDRIYHLQNTKTVAQKYRIDWVFTIPTFFSEEITARFAQIIHDSRFMDNINNTLEFVTEPEAAIIRVLQMRVEKGPGYENASSSLQVNDVVLVCDAGGGTTDLQAFKIEQLRTTNNPDSRLRICPVYEHHGAPVGAMDVIRAFESRLDKVRDSVVSDLPQVAGNGQLERDIALAKNSFEMIKTNFDGSTSNFVSHRIPFKSVGIASLPRAGITSGYLEITVDVLKSVFQGVIMELVRHIANYKTTLAEMMIRVKTLILVGGLSASPYIAERIRSWAGEHGLELITPPNIIDKLSSVMFGAVEYKLQQVMTGLPPTTQVIARSSFGFILDEPYTHQQGSTAEIDRFSGDTIVKEQIRWVVKKGQRFPIEILEESANICGHIVSTRHKVRCFKKASRKWEFRLMRSEEDEQNLPVSLTNGSKSKDKSLLEIMNVTIDLSNQKIHRFRKITRQVGKNRWPYTSKIVYYEADIELRVHMLAGGAVTADVITCGSPGLLNPSTQKRWRPFDFPRWRPGKASSRPYGNMRRNEV